MLRVIVNECHGSHLQPFAKADLGRSVSRRTATSSPRTLSRNMWAQVGTALNIGMAVLRNRCLTNLPDGRELTLIDQPHPAPGRVGNTKYDKRKRIQWQWCLHATNTMA